MKCTYPFPLISETIGKRCDKSSEVQVQFLSAYLHIRATLLSHQLQCFDYGQRQP